MYKLHIYNPEHDIALGKNTDMFTPPKAARMMHDAYGHIPAFWAEDGDWILVNDVAHAQQMLDEERAHHADVRLVDADDLRRLTIDELPSEILPWGWDKYLVKRLLMYNPLFEGLVLDAAQLDVIRRLSSREFAAHHLLPDLVASDDRLVGRMSVVKSMEELIREMESHDGNVVLKSPWSCSGRGVRFVSCGLTESEAGWCRNVLAEQGAMMVEPIYPKLCDFAMEFMSDKDSGTRYLGLNVFETRYGAYLYNNVYDSDLGKRQLLAHYVSEELLNKVRAKIEEMTTELFHGIYSGPFGIDMMIVDSSTGVKMHPCVEMNLRRTMGHMSL